MVKRHFPKLVFWGVNLEAIPPPPPKCRSIVGYSCYSEQQIESICSISAALLINFFRHSLVSLGMGNGFR